MYQRFQHATAADAIAQAKQRAEERLQTHRQAAAAAAAQRTGTAAVLKAQAAPSAQPLVAPAGTCLLARIIIRSCIV